MKIRVNTKSIELISTEQVNTGECNVVTLECELSEEYASTINFAVFKYATLGGEKVIKNKIIYGECKLPVFIDTDKVKIGVYGFELENDELKKRYSPTMVEIDLREGTYQEGIDDYTTEQGTDFERYVAEIEELIGDIKEVDSIDIVNNHLIVTYTNGEMHDAGVIEGGGGTGDYDKLINQPQVNGNTLTGNKTSADLGLQDRTIVTGTDGKNYYVQFGMQSGKPVLILTEVTNE